MQTPGQSVRAYVTTGGIALRYITAMTAALLGLWLAAAHAETQPTTLRLVPPAQTQAGRTVQLAAKLTCDGKALAHRSVTFTVGAWSAAADTDALGIARVAYETEAAGQVGVRVRFAGTDEYKEATAEGIVTVQAPTAATLTLSLAPNPVAAGGKTTAKLTGEAGQDCTARARFGVTPGAGGTWDGATYTSQGAGEWRVTGSYGPLGATETLIVRPGPAAQVRLAPTSTMAARGEVCTLTVTCSDAFGNRWQATLPADAWRATIGEAPAAGSFNDANGYTPGDSDKNQTVTVRCTVDGVESEPAEVRVHGKSGIGLILAWDKDTRRFYLCGNPTNPATGRILEPGENIVGPTRITVSSSVGNLTATVTNVGAPENSLRVRWQVRGDELVAAYQYSTVAGETKAVTYSRGKTTVDGAYREGFWGLVHRLDAGAPRAIAATTAPQR